jgi:DUF4097 and DUF4098 domain-containing protein YvlB
MEKTFETPGPVRLRVELLVGDVAVRAAATTTTTVLLVPRGRDGGEMAERFTVEQHGDEILVHGPKREGLFGWATKGSVDVEVILPERSELDARTGSGDLAATGILGRTMVTTASGEVTADEIAGGDFKSGSGDLEVRAVRGAFAAKTGSGDLTVGTANGELDLISGSGDVDVRRAESRVRAKTGSGDVTIGASASDIEVLTGSGDVQLGGIHGGQVRARTGTGDVVLGVVTGVAAYLDLNTLTGDVHIALEDSSGPEGADATASLTVNSGSGDVRILRAQVSLA